MTHDEAVKTFAAERYLLGEMTADERDRYEDHYFGCTTCAEDVRSGAVLQDGIRAGFVHGAAASTTTGRVVPFRSRSRIVSTVLPWAVAATFAVIAGYQTVGGPGSLQGPASPNGPGRSNGPAVSLSNGPIALAPTTLRPATRGAEPVAVAGPGGLVTLAVDLGSLAASSGSAPGTLDYTITDDNGRAVASGQLPAPTAGSPLLLVLPAGTVTPGGHFALHLKDPRNADLTPLDYGFSVGAQ